jgi:hypothetical protein
MKKLRPADLSFSGYTLSSSGAYFNSLLLVTPLAEATSSKAKQMHRECLARLLNQQTQYIQRIVATDAILQEAGFGCPKKPHYPNEFFAWEEALRTKLETRFPEQSSENAYFSLGWRLGDLQTDLELLHLSGELHLRLFEERHYSAQIQALLQSILELEPQFQESLTHAKKFLDPQSMSHFTPEFQKVFEIAKIHARFPTLDNEAVQSLTATSKELSRYCVKAAHRVIERLEEREVA